MNGKIFSDSSNIYQDQAKVLFNYYKRVAEEVVAKEEAIEKEISIASEYCKQMEDEASKAKTYKMVSFCLFFTIVGLIYGFIYMQKEKRASREIMLSNEKIKALKENHAAIFRDYKMTKLGVAYVPVASQVAFEDKSIIVDHTGTVKPEEFKLQILRQNDLLKDKINELELLAKTAPIVENSNEPEEVETEQYSRSIQKVVYNDYFGKLDRSLRTFTYCLNDLDESTVKLPLIHPETKYAEFLAEHGTDNVGDAPVFEIYDMEEYNADVSKFHSINELRKSLSTHTSQIDEVLRKLMVNMADSVQTIASIKVASANKIVDHSNSILFQILKSSYNHYSPLLEAEEIDRIKTENFNYSDLVEEYKPFNLKQSSKVKYDIISNCWVAEDGSKTIFPFGINQIQEEIVAPIVQNLLSETRLERLKIYNHIKDQKLDYLNKWHQDTEDFYGRNRAESADLINLMRANLRDYIAAYNTLISLQKTADSMKDNNSLEASIVEAEENVAESFAAFDVQSKEFQKIQIDFEEYMERLKDDIDQRAAKFEHIEFYDASLRDANSHQLAVAAGRVQELDARRKPLSAVNPLFAETSELPPAPNIEPLAYEHIGINLSALADSVLSDIDNEQLEYELNRKAQNDIDNLASQENQTVEDEEIEDETPSDNNEDLDVEIERTNADEQLEPEDDQNDDQEDDQEDEADEIENDSDIDESEESEEETKKEQ